MGDDRAAFHRTEALDNMKTVDDLSIAEVLEQGVSQGARRVVFLRGWQ